MKPSLSGKKLTIILIVILTAGSSGIYLVEWFDETIINPRVWRDWTCEEMKQFAIGFEDEVFTEFQRAKFHEDLSSCIGSQP